LRQPGPHRSPTAPVPRCSLFSPIHPRPQLGRSHNHLNHASKRKSRPAHSGDKRPLTDRHRTNTDDTTPPGPNSATPISASFVPRRDFADSRNPCSIRGETPRPEFGGGSAALGSPS
jgi:hypothetical protein